MQSQGLQLYYVYQNRQFFTIGAIRFVFFLGIRIAHFRPRRFVPLCRQPHVDLSLWIIRVDRDDLPFALTEAQIDATVDQTSFVQFLQLATSLQLRCIFVSSKSPAKIQPPERKIITRSLSL